jgi:hypothetical protein
MAKIKLSHHALIRFIENAFAFDFAELRTDAAVWLGKPSSNRVDDGEFVRFIEAEMDLDAFRTAFYVALNGAPVINERKGDIFRRMKGDLVAVISKETSTVKTVLPPDFLVRKSRPWNLQLT